MKKLYQIFLLLSRGKQIAVAVGLVHLLILFILACHHLISSHLRAPRPMVIKTIVPLVKPLAKKVEVAATPSPSPPKTANPKSIKPAPIPPKKAKLPIATLPPPAKKMAKSPILKEIAESFDAIAATEIKKEKFSTLHIPSKVTREVPIVEEESQEDATYGEYLIAFLQSSLDLPEYGEVKMEIEIDSFGRLKQCQILESKNQKNATFLKEEIALLNFPIPQLGRFENSKKLTVIFKNQ